jgi:ABC-type transporter Mla MlaB component
MADCRVETNGREKILHLSGELLIDYAGQLRNILIDYLKDTDRAKIDISSATAIDISCLQLFCAAHKTSAEMDKVLDLLDAPSAVFADTVRRAGCIRPCGCTLDKVTPCLWREERFGG